VESLAWVSSVETSSVTSSITRDVEILVVEDSATQAMQLKYSLEQDGYSVRVSGSGKEGLAAVRMHKPNLIVSDVIMPGMNGYELCHAIKHDQALNDIPVILLTSLSDQRDIIKGIGAGADYYVIKPFEEVHLLAMVKAAIENPAPLRSGKQEKLSVNIDGKQESIEGNTQQVLNLLLSTCESAVRQNRGCAKLQHALERLNNDLEERVRERTDALKTSFIGTAEALSALSEGRDPYTAGHSKKVAELSQQITRKLGWSADDIEGITACAILHDIGKMVVPASILSKPGKLSAFEWGMIKEHPTTAYEVLKHVAFPWPVAEVVYQHHERLDGTGYPQGLRGDQIHPWARVLAVADVLDAMVAHRPYGPALPLSKAVEELKRGRDTVYDIDVVDACLMVLGRAHNRVLIVDDESEIVELLSTSLRREGLDVEGFDDPRKALKAFEKKPFPLVITDLQMNHMNGLELLERVKQVDASSKVIMITGFGEKEEAVRALRLGAMDFIEKPLCIAEFKDTVMNALLA